MSLMESKLPKNPLGLTKPPDSLGKFEKKGVDFVSSLDKLVNEEKAQADKNLNALAIDPLKFTNMAGDLKVLKELREINEAMEKEEYSHALNLLNRFLSTNPYHHEAIYLLGYCYSKLNEPERALMSLKTIQDANLSQELSEKVQMLLKMIRGQMRPIVMIENLMLLMSGQVERAVGRLLRCIELDPTCSLYYFLASGTLMKAGKTKQGFELVELGIKNCNPEPVKQVGALAIASTDKKYKNPDMELLYNQRDQIEHIYVSELLQNSRKLFKNKRFAQAAKKMQSDVPQRLQGAEVYRLFSDYLSYLQPTGGFFFKKTPEISTASLPTDMQQTDVLCMFLVGQEINQAKHLSDQGQFDAAEQIMSQALSLVPNYPYVNYLYASQVLFSLFYRLYQGNLNPNDALIKLELAQKSAIIGMTDKTISDAGELKNYIAELIAQLLEAQKVAPIVNAYQSLITRLNSDRSKTINLGAYINELKAIKNDAVKAQRTASPDLKAMLGQIITQIDEDCLALEIGEAISSFNATMGRLEKSRPPLSYQQLNTFRQEIQSAWSKANTLLTRLPADAQGRDQVVALEKAAKNVLDQIPK